MPGKRVQFDDEMWEAIEAVAHSTGTSFKKLAHEAFADLGCRLRLDPDVDPIAYSSGSLSAPAQQPHGFRAGANPAPASFLVTLRVYHSKRISDLGCRHRLIIRRGNCRSGLRRVSLGPLL
jgi:hypothetical protein